MNDNYPQVLHELYDFLTRHSFELNQSNHLDGRIISIEKERDVIDAIQKHFNCIIPKTRSWYDIALYHNDIPIYCNIKISKGGVDNANQKKAIIYSLTTLDENRIKNSLDYNMMFQLIEEHLTEYRDYTHEYYYIYIDKNDNSIIIRSICDIEHFQSNPCNYLQINWCKEKQYINKNIVENDIIKIKDKILFILAKSIKQFIDKSNKLVGHYYSNNDLGI